MRGRELRSGWGRREGGVRERGGGAYSLARGWNMGCLCLGRGFTASPSPLNLLHSLFIVPNHSGYCLLRIYTGIFTLWAGLSQQCHAGGVIMPCVIYLALPIHWKDWRWSWKWPLVAHFIKSAAGAYSPARPGSCWPRLPVSSHPSIRKPTSWTGAKRFQPDSTSVRSALLPPFTDE